MVIIFPQSQQLQDKSEKEKKNHFKFDYTYLSNLNLIDLFRSLTSQISIHLANKILRY
jgi:hypothetical protein